MVTALIAGIPVPLWDRPLVRALREAVLEAPDDDSTSWAFWVMNDQGQFYRRVVAENTWECFKILECFTVQDFHLEQRDGRPVMRKTAAG